MSRPSRRARRNRPLVVALYVNAVLLAGLLVAVLKPGSGLESTAIAAPPMPQLAGGAGLYLMPAQFSPTMWGCYVLDTDKQTLCAYEYAPQGKQLRLLAARHFRHDRDLTSYNTTPAPEEIERLIALGANAVRGKEPTPESPENTNVPPDDPSAPTVPPLPPLNETGTDSNSSFRQ